LVGPVEAAEELGARLAAVLLEDGAQDLAEMSHPSVAPRMEPLNRGTVHPNPSSTTTERVS
jgi:hypothetical protein